MELIWNEAKPGNMPEDKLPLSKYKLWGKERKATPYVLVIREDRERPDCAKRVQIEDGKWYWTDGDGITLVTYWASYERPVAWDQKAHEERIKQFMKQAKQQSK